MDRRFAPKAPRFGVMPEMVDAANVGNITASATTTFFLTVPARKCYIEQLSFSTNTVAAGGSTILATFKKRDVAGATTISLNSPSAGSAATGDLKSMTTLNNHIITMSTTNGTDKDRILQPGDTLWVEVVAAGTVTTQPTNLCFGVELLVLN